MFPAAEKVSRLHEDRSVTDRTVGRSIIGHDHNDEGEIDRVNGCLVSAA